MVAAPMLREILLWWLRQMRALLPERLLPDAWRGDALLVEACAPGPSDTPQVRLKLRRRGQETPLGDFCLDEAGRHAAGTVVPRPAGQVILRPDNGAVLCRKVSLPLAAEYDLQRVLRYEMDRLTPFTAEQVFWSAETERRNRDAGRLEISLLLAPKSLVQSVISALASIGLDVGAIETTTTDGMLRRIDLAALSSPRSRWLPIAWGAVAVLALAALVTPFITQALAFNAIDARIAALQPRVAEVDSLRKRIAAGSAGNDVIAAEHASTGNALQVLAAVTDLLPDDTVLADLSLRQGKLSISGRSRSAPQLIPAMAGDPILHNPSFAAPVTRTPDGKSDTFVIRAELNP
jgi:general secretion pathway protein L